MVWYTGVDKDIYESGVHFRPQQRYLTTDYVWPTEGGDAGGGGGSGIPAAANYVNQDQSNYSVYNPDPNRTTLPTRYRPYDARKASEYSFVDPYRAKGEFGYNTETEMQKHMDMYPGYYNPKTNKYMEFAKNLVPAWMKAGAGIVRELLPENPTGIMRNEMLGQGFALDDIGRVVMQQTGWTTGPDGKRTFGAIAGTDPRNVMAGYNLTNYSEEDMESGNNAFDRRLSKLESRFAKGAISQDTYNTYKNAIEGAKQNWLDAQANKLQIVKWRKDKKQKIKDKKIRKDLEGTGASLTDQDQITNILTTEQNDSPAPGQGKTDAWQETFSGTQDGGGEFENLGPQTDQGGNQGGGWSGADWGSDEGEFAMSQGGRVYLNLGGIASVLGREGFAEGGRNWMGDYDPGNTTGWQEKGQVETWNPGGDGETTTTFTGGDGGGNEPPTVVENKNVVDVDWKTTKPEINVNLDRSKYLAQLDLIESLKNQQLEAELAGTIGPVDFSTMINEGDIGNTNINYGNWSADISPNANIDQISYNRNIGDWDFGANYTGDGNYGIKFSKSYKHGGLASIL